MSEKDTINFLAEFDRELWNKFKDKHTPYGDTLKGIVRDLIKVFLGDLEGVNEELKRELRMVLANE